MSKKKHQLVKRISNLPVKPKDLAEFILIGKKALIAQKAKLEAIQILEKGFAAKEAALSDTQDLAEVLLYAEAKLGELIPQPKQGKKEYGSSGGTIPTLPEGVNKKQSHYAQQLNKNKKTIAQVVAKAREEGEVPIRQQVLREIQKAKPKPETPELPEGKYNVIYADPPWKYNVGEQHGEEGTTQETTLKTHYPSMSIEEICELPVPDIVAKNAVLFLWATSPLVWSQEAFQVIDSWGFEAKACFVWDKVKHNVGHYNSARHEFLIIAIKGSYPLHHKKLYDSVQSIERTKHSTKPEKFREIIDDIYCRGKRIELFRRGKKIKNWDIWGAEAKTK